MIYNASIIESYHLHLIKGIMPYSQAPNKCFLIMMKERGSHTLRLKILTVKENS